MDSRHWRRIAAALLMLVFMLARLTSPARATPAARTPITISYPALGGITPVPAATGSTHPV